MRTYVFFLLILSLGFTNCDRSNEHQSLSHFLATAFGEDDWQVVFIIPESGCTFCVNSIVKAFNEGGLGEEALVVLIANSTKNIAMHLRNPEILKSPKVRVISVADALSYPGLNTEEPLLLLRTNAQAYESKVISYHELSDLVILHRKRQ